MESKKLFFVDAETDGLYGPFISVAVIVTDAAGMEIERTYYGIRKEKLTVQNEWVLEHVVPLMGEYEPCENEEELLRRVWDMWLRYYDSAYAVGDVIYPVEARLFEKCVEQFCDNPLEQGPFPLLDIATMLFGRGIDPNIHRETYIGRNDDGADHNALYDIETTIEVYKKLMMEDN